MEMGRVPDRYKVRRTAPANNTIALASEKSVTLLGVTNQSEFGIPRWEIMDAVYFIPSFMPVPQPDYASAAQVILPHPHRQFELTH